MVCVNQASYHFEQQLRLHLTGNSRVQYNIHLRADSPVGVSISHFFFFFINNTENFIRPHCCGERGWLTSICCHLRLLPIPSQSISVQPTTSSPSSPLLLEVSGSCRSWLHRPRGGTGRNNGGAGWAEIPAPEAPSCPWPLHRKNNPGLTRVLSGLRKPWSRPISHFFKDCSSDV